MFKYEVISGRNTGKHGPEITPYLDTFHAVRSFDSFYNQTVIPLQTYRLINPRIKHQNNTIIFLEYALSRL